jgi:hypothetical protein
VLHARELFLPRNKHCTLQQEGKKQLAAIIRVQTQASGDSRTQVLLLHTNYNFSCL